MIERLIKECLDGDRKAQKELYYLHLDELKLISIRYTRIDAEAKDVLQNAFVRIFKNLSKVDSSCDSLLPWMKKIVINEALRVRKGQFTISIEDAEDYLSLTSKDSDGFNQLATQDLVNIINQLPEKYNVVFQLKEIEGFSHAEIGRILGVETSTSRSILTRAKSQLKELFNYYYQSNKSKNMVRS